MEEDFEEATGQVGGGEDGRGEGGEGGVTEVRVVELFLGEEGGGGRERFMVSMER